MKTIKWCLMGIGIIFVLATFAALLSNIIFSHQFRKTFTRLRVEGRPTTIAELQPTSIPVDQNAARLFEKAALLLTNKPVPTAIHELSKLVQEFEYQNRNLDLRDFPANKRELVMSLIKEPGNKALYAILSQATHKPGDNSHLNSEKTPALNAIAFHYIRQLMGFLALKAEAAAYKGNGNEAGQVLLDGFRLACLLKQEPDTIQLLMSISCDAIQMNSLYRITNSLDLPAEALRSLEEELQSHIDAARYARAMDEDRIIALTEYQALLDGTYRDVRTVVRGGMKNFPPAHAWVYRTFGLLHRAMTVYLTLQAEIQDACRMPSDRILASLRQNPIQKQIPAFCPLSHEMLQRLELILYTKVRTEAALQVTRVGLALKRYKMANGVYPDTLENLTPSFLDRIPKDPCSGNSLLYRKEGKGFLLYSVGSDLQDNQGAQFNSIFPGAPYDYVWKALR
jgi:hypothetical protein